MSTQASKPSPSSHQYGRLPASLCHQAHAHPLYTQPDLHPSRDTSGESHLPHKAAARLLISRLWTRRLRRRHPQYININRRSAKGTRIYPYSRLPSTAYMLPNGRGRLTKFYRDDPHHHRTIQYPTIRLEIMSTFSPRSRNTEVSIELIRSSAALRLRQWSATFEPFLALH